MAVEGSAAFANLWSSSTFPWEATAVILTFLMFSVSAIAYMLSRVFISKDMEKWAKTEFMYALSGVVLIAFIIFLVDVLAVKAMEFSVLVASDRVMLQQAIANDPSPFAVADAYIGTMLNCVRRRYLDLMALAFVPKLLSGVGVASLVTSSSTLQLLGGGLLDTMLNIVKSAVYTMTYLVYSLSFQHHLLLFARQTMLTIFLPIGIVLRAFLFTRSPGNLLIAIALGFYFVYPVSYGIMLSMSAPIEQIYGSCGLSGYSSLTNYLNSASASESGGVSLFTSSWSSFGFGKVWGLVARVSLYIGHLSLMLAKLPSVLSELVIYAIFYPFVIAVVTYTFIKGFSTFLGVEAQEFAQGLIKLV